MPDPKRAAELRDLGYAAYRQGNYARARQHFERALALSDAAGADTATAHSDLGATQAALGDLAAALRHHEAALGLRRADGPAAALAATLHNLGATYRQLGRHAEAEASHAEAVTIWSRELGPHHPMVARGLSSLGALARQRGDSAQAEQYWQRALALLRQAHGETHPSLAPLLNNLGVLSRSRNQVEQAAAYFSAALAAEPALVTAQHNLSATLSRLGRHDEARRHRDQALARENIFIQAAPDPAAPRVLILSHADAGNVPLEHMIPEPFFTRIWWFPAHGGARKAAALPAHDIVFNGLGDADMTGATSAAIEAFLHGGKKVLNHPAQIAATRRDRLADTLADIDGCLLPPVIRLQAPPAMSVQAQTEAAGIAPPLLLRPAGTHGGSGVTRIENWAEAPAAVPAGYAMPFIDCRGADGFVRKYRVIFVDRVPYPYHLAISPNWMVHYFSADMEAHGWKLAEEAAFLAAWHNAIGPMAAAAIAHIGQRLNLDFCGVDFAVLPDGRAVIFEANATMLVHPEAPAGPLAFKNEAVDAITAAMRHMLANAAVPAP